MSPELSANLHNPDQNVENLFPHLEEVLVAGNRGPCGGVKMAIESVNQVLSIVDGREKVYINWDVVNNVPLMEDLKEKGLVNVRNDLSKVPEDSIFLFSAHGVPPSLRDEADRRNLLTIDTTCQLVTRVHNLAIRAARNGTHVFFIGDEEHPETQGVLGELQPHEITLIEKPEDVETIELDEGEESIVFSKTTLGASEIAPTMRRLREKLGDALTIPSKLDACYATDNRQASVDSLLNEIDALIVVGSEHSHNTQELRRKGEKRKIPSFSVDTPEEIEVAWFDESIRRLGITSGASVIPSYTERVLDVFRREGIPINMLPQTIEEDDMMFKLPIEDIDRLKNRYDK